MRIFIVDSGEILISKLKLTNHKYLQIVSMVQVTRLPTITLIICCTILGVLTFYNHVVIKYLPPNFVYLSLIKLPIYDIKNPKPRFGSCFLFFMYQNPAYTLECDPVFTVQPIDIYRQKDMGNRMSLDNITIILI
jgi:hypothetical protein